MPATDSRRSRVYAAEHQVERLLDRAAAGATTVDFFGSGLTLPVERRFADIASMQRWCDEVLAFQPVVQQWPGTPPVRVRERKGLTRAHYQAPGEIAVPLRTRWAARELVLCHELAHHLVCHDPAVASDVAGHGGPFLDAYADLVEGVIGPEVALLLRAGFDAAGARP
jgi:putative metallohydrolase (TIGR04338 family)